MKTVSGMKCASKGKKGSDKRLSHTASYRKADTASVFGVFTLRSQVTSFSSLPFTMVAAVFGSQMSPKSSCIEGLAHNAAILRGGTLER